VVGADEVVAALLRLCGCEGEVILGNISAFKEHCSFGLWGSGDCTAAASPMGSASSEGMGTFGKITSLADLPSRS
jgi:hypothetical protein